MKAPPVHPWPQVAAELGNLEETREKIENAKVNQLQASFIKAAEVGQRRIGEILGEFSKNFDDANVLLSSAALLG